MERGEAVNEAPMTEIQPGTRCECRAEAHNYTSYFPPDVTIGHKPGECTADAVRFVTVVGRGNFTPIPGYESSQFRHVPFCAACATYHESKVTR